MQVFGSLHAHIVKYVRENSVRLRINISVYAFHISQREILHAFIVALIFFWLWFTTYVDSDEATSTKAK